MTEAEIKEDLNAMRTEPRYKYQGDTSIKFFVKDFNRVKHNLIINTTLGPHTIPVANYVEFTKSWHKEPQKPKEAPIHTHPPAVAKSAKPAKLEAVKSKDITGAATKYVHITSPVTVYVTKDYGMFQHTKGNRVLNKNKIKKIVTDIKGGLNRLADYPIVVEQTNMQVKDGQHRLECAIQTGSNIYYIFAEPMQLHEIARVNSNTERWKKGDFLQCYIEQGSEDYKKLKAFLDSYHFPLTTSLQLLQGMKLNEGGSDNMLQRFEQGLFTTKEKYISDATNLAERVMLFSEFSGHLSRNFILAIDMIKGKNLCDWTVLLDKFKRKPELLKANQSKKDFIANLEQIYNLGSHKRQIIYQ